jgi:hypothetical protein
MAYPAKTKRTFLDNLAKAGTITAAADLTGVDRQTVYNWRNKDKKFASDMAAALDNSTQILEDEAYRRAMGKSDLLLMFLLKSRDPKYRDRQETNLNVDITISNQIIEARKRSKLVNGEQLEPCRNLNNNQQQDTRSDLDIEHQPNSGD